MFEETLKFYQNFPKEGINFVDIMPFLSLNLLRYSKTST